MPIIYFERCRLAYFCCKPDCTWRHKGGKLIEEKPYCDMPANEAEKAVKLIKKRRAKDKKLQNQIVKKMKPQPNHQKQFQKKAVFERNNKLRQQSET